MRSKERAAHARCALPASVLEAFRARIPAPHTMAAVTSVDDEELRRHLPTADILAVIHRLWSFFSSDSRNCPMTPCMTGHYNEPVKKILGVS